MTKKITDLDFIIVGQGLAGSILAWKLLQHNKNILIIDDGHISSSSKVAAGIVNPISGKRLALSLSLDLFLPAAKKLYDELHAFFNKQFYFNRTVLRFIDNPSLVDKRYNDPAFLPYLGQRFHDRFEILGGGYLETELFLSTLKEYFISKNCLLQEPFDYSLDNFPNKKIIFAEGYKVIHNPWFKDEPWAPAKGEILDLNIDHDLENYIYNNGKWVLPLENGSFRAGSTFSWDPLDLTTTDLAKDQILAKVHEMIPHQATVIRHQAGIRPSTKASLPIIKTHPDNSNLICFNGFGSKGTLSIPYYAEQFSL